jgi:hypothetical protein
MTRPAVTFERPTLYEAEAIQAEIDRLENLAFWYRKQARKARVWNAFRKLIDTDLFFIVVGALMAADIGLLLMMARS